MDPSKNPTDPNKIAGSPELTPTGGPEDAPPLLLSQITDDDDFVTPAVAVVEESSNDRFNMALVHGQDVIPETTTKLFDERDYQSHRRESFPHPHQPLKPIRITRRKMSASRPVDVTEKQGAESMPTTTGGSASSTPIKIPRSPPPQPLSDTFDVLDEEELIDSQNNPLLLLTNVSTSFPFTGVPSSDPLYATKLFDDMMEISKKVQFQVGGSPPETGMNEEITEKKKHKSHRNQKYEDPQWRRRQGSEMKDDSADVPLLLLRDADTSEMLDLDKDDLTSHRFGDAKGFRRHKFYLKETEGTEKVTHMSSRNTKYDHKPHEVYVELDILSGLGDDREWKETARWIKYEEDVEEGADRWGKPHVASLSFHSLINLRHLIESGVVLLDLEERDLPGIAYRVVDQMVISELVDIESKGYIMRALLLKHKHVNDCDKGWKFNLRRNTGSLTSLHDSSKTPFDEKNKGKVLSSAASMEPAMLHRRNSATVAGIKGLDNGAGGKRNGSFVATDHTTVDLSKASLGHLSEEDMRWMVNKESILRRIPVGAEASVVLVGIDEKLDGPAMAFVRLAESVYMPNITEVPIPVRFIFVLLGPSRYDLDYKEIGRSISTLMSNREFHAIAYKADDRKDLLKGIHEYLDESIVLPPGEYEKELFPFDDLKEKNEALKLRKQRMSISAKGVGGGGGDGDKPDHRKLLEDGKKKARTFQSPLSRTRRCFGGLIDDVRRRYPFYLSDFKDGFSFQCLAAIIFMSCAQVSGSIALGGLMSSKTDKQIGISETLLTSAFGGIFFSLLSGQPLLIVATSGPLLLFDSSLFTFCKANNIDFLAMRTWIGVWVSVIALVFVAFEVSNLVRFFTRFTQEIFASLISLLFILESILNLVDIYKAHPLVSTYGICEIDPLDVTQAKLTPGSQNFNQPNTALLCTILMFGTFSIAWFFRVFRNSHFLSKSIRDTLGNFAVPIAIVAMVLVDYLIKETVTQKLEVPEGLNPTYKLRSWLINPDEVKSWTQVLLALIPGLLLFVLLFMEVSIGELLVSKHEYKLTKGSGFHLDILLICLVNTGICFLGLPWVSVALVRAVAHTSALTVWSTNNPPGEKPVIMGLKEQRLTSLTVSIITGASVAMANVLVLMPMAVLFGVFLFMGISSMSGIQFFERIALFIKQVEHHPSVPYVRRVRTWKMHLFTVIQIGWLALLWGVKYTPAALTFPFILIILVPFRFFVLPLMFKADELSALDSNGDERKEIVIETPLTTDNGLAVNGERKNKFNSLTEEHQNVKIYPSTNLDEELVARKVL